MVTRSRANQYPGINAHLHSYWQGQGGWDEFHTSHITYLTSSLKALLLPMGYTAGIEQSLQIRRADVPAGKPKSYVTIYDENPMHSSDQYRSVPADVQDTHAMVLTLPEVLIADEELADYNAIALYTAQTAHGQRGQPVAWVELLSPSNKPGGQDSLYYRTKRLKLLQSGLIFVELDYLHESPSTFSAVADYTSSTADNAHPYRIVVVDPRPTRAAGKVYLHQFDVDQALPTVTIPLVGADSVLVDFGALYQKTIEDVYFALEFVDYRVLPLNFERYHEPDQARIVTRMIAVIEAALRGVNLETGVPLDVSPLSSLSLAEALERLTVLLNHKQD